MKISNPVVGLLLGVIFIAVLIKLDVIDISQSPSASMSIPAVELQKVLERAKGGDLVSTNRMVNHYLISEGDEPTGLIWARLGAEQGDQDLRRFVVGVLSRSSLDADREESKKLAAQWKLPAQ